MKCETELDMISSDDSEGECDEAPVPIGKGGLAKLSNGEDALDVLRAAGVRIQGDPEDPRAFRASFNP